MNGSKLTGEAARQCLRFIGGNRAACLFGYTGRFENDNLNEMSCPGHREYF